MPIRDIYLQLGLASGCARSVTNDLGSISINENDAREYRELGLPEEPFVVLNPNASDLMIERRWPIQKFCALSRELSKTHKVVVIGSKAERGYVSVFDRENAINLAGRLSLGGLLVLLRKCRVLVTNDTGPMHLALALNTPTVCLFGPVKPMHYGVQKQNVRIIYKPLYCSPCVHEVDEPPCRGNNVCMQRIQVPEVLEACMALIRGQTDNSRPDLASESFFVGENSTPLGRIERASIDNE